MKTKEELQVLTEEMKSLNTKLEELTKDELEQVIGGQSIPEQLTKRSLLAQAILGGVVLHNIPTTVDDEKCVIMKTREADKRIL